MAMSAIRQRGGLSLPARMSNLPTTTPTSYRLSPRARPRVRSGRMTEAHTIL